MPNWLREAGWSFSFNDPTLFGWAMTAAYVICAALAFRLWSRSRRDGSLLSRFWLVLAIAILLLGFNKQLDLQMLLVKSASRIAQAAGLYGRKELIRIGIVGAALAAVCGTGAWLFTRKREYLPRNPFLWASIATILLFVLVRTKALDGVFQSIGLGPDRNWAARILESIGVFGLGAVLLREVARRSRGGTRG